MRRLEPYPRNYRNQNGGRVSEVLKFDDDPLVAEGHGTYLGADASAGA